MDTWIIILEGIFSAIIISIHIYITILLWKNKSEQPIKSKSPGLLLIFSICITASTLSLCLLLIISSIEDINNTKQNSVILIFLSISEIMAAPISFITYIARYFLNSKIFERGAQSSNIYHVPKGFDNSKIISEDEGYQMYGQPKYIRKVLYFAFFTIPCEIIFLSFGVKFSDKLDISLAIFMLNLYTLLITTITMILIFVYAKSLLHRLYEIISLGFEFLSLLFVIFVTSTIYHIIMISQITQSDLSKISTMLSFCGLALIIRNLSCTIITLVLPLIKSKTTFIINYNETSDCSKSLEVTLCSRIGYLHFTKFIENKCGNAGMGILILFNLLMVRKYKIKCNKNTEKIEKEITNFYNSENEVKYELEAIQKYQKGNVNTYDSLADRVIHKMDDYFRNFKESKHFEQLQKSLFVREIINERLQLSNLI